MKYTKNRHIRTLLFWALQMLGVGLFAQAPSLINYQGSARLANGIPLGNKTIGIKFDIHEGSATGSVVASETQALQTNLLGLFVTQIGKNTNIGNLNWQTNTMFLEVSIDTTGGSSYTSLGTQQMVSVPYAMNAAHVPSSYTGNVLTIGSSSFALTPTMAVTPNTSITVSGVGTVSSAGTNTFDINIPAPTFTNTGQQIITGSYPNFTVNTPSVASVPDQTLTGTGLVNVTNPATNSFVIDVQSPTFNNTGQQIITGTYPNYTVTTPTVAAVPDQTLTGTGIVNVTNPATNSFVIDVQTPAFTGLGTASVSGSYPNYTVNSSIPTFTNTDQPIIVGSYPNFTVNTPTVAAVPDQTITGSGMVTVSHPATNSFVVGVPAPTLSIGSGSIAITGGNSVALPTTPSVSAAGIATVSSGPNYVVGVPAPSLSIGSGSISIIGSNSVALPTTPSVSAAGIATVSAGPNYVVGVPAPTLSIGSGSIAITGGNSVALPTTPSVSAAGIATVSSGPNYVVGVPAPTLSIGSGSIAITGGNSVALPTTPSVSAAGIATVSSGPNYVVGVPAPTLSIGSGSIAITGGNSVALPTTPSVSAAGIATVSAGPNYMVGVQTPTFTNTGQNIITGSYPNFSVNTPTVAGTSIAVTATAAAGPSVSTIGTNSFNINIPPQSAGWALTGNAGTTPGTDFIGTTDAQDLLIRSNNVDRIKVTSTGFVGIGSGYNPGAPLVVEGSSANLGIFKLYNSHASGGDKTFLGFNVSSGSDGFDIARIGSERSAGGGEGRLLFMTGGQGSQVERMRIDEFGSIGIGTSSPNGHLHLHSPNASYALARLTSSAATTGLVSYIDGASAGITNYENTPLYIGVNIASRMSISPAGNMNIMTGVGLASEKLNVDGNISLQDFSGNAPNRIIGFPVASVGNHGMLTIQAKGNVSNSIAHAGGNLLLAAGDFNVSGAGGSYGGELIVRAGRNVFDGSGGGNIIFQAGGGAYTERMRIVGMTGNVGIGTNAPTAMLHVAGTTRLVDGTEGAGKVLTSDAAGNASWQAAAGGSRTRSVILDVASLDVTNQLSVLPGAYANIGGWQRPVLQFAEGSVLQVQTQVPIPSDWNGTSAFTVTVLYSSPTTGNNFYIDFGWASNGINSSMVTATFGNTVSAPESTTANGLMEISNTLGVYSATDKVIFINVRRNASSFYNANDTSPSTMYIHGIRLDYKD